MMRIAILATVAAFASVPASAGDYAPRNECRHLQGYAEFERNFVTAVVNRDEQMLLERVDEEVLLDFGGGAGHATLRERLDDPDYQLWTELEALLPLGCAPSDDGGFAMPWIWGQDLEIDDPFAAMFVIGTDIPAYVRPDPASQIVARMSWDMVEMVEWNEGPYSNVRLADGRTAYVSNDSLRSIVDYRMLVDAGDDGEFRITVFVAGD